MHIQDTGFEEIKMLKMLIFYLPSLPLIIYGVFLLCLKYGILQVSAFTSSSQNVFLANMNFPMALPSADIEVRQICLQTLSLILMV